MAKHVQAPPKPPSVHRPGLDMELEAAILKALAKRPEDRFQTGHEFDEAISRIADRLYPGWRRSLEPGADLSNMVPGAAPVAAIAAAPLGTHPATAVPAQAVYNPAPPVKPVSRAAGCLGALVGVISSSAVLALLAAAYLR
jgi:serine/threonine-protein kinase